MEAIVTPPIFVLDREGWISVFDSLDSAESGLETADVETGEYVALDASGRPLVLTVIESARTGRWFSQPAARVRLDVGSADATPDLLRRVLVEALAANVARDQPLDSLVPRARAGKYLRAGRIIGEVRAALSPVRE
jgi:hypothetical protein